MTSLDNFGFNFGPSRPTTKTKNTLASKGAVTNRENCDLRQWGLVADLDESIGDN